MRKQILVPVDFSGDSINAIEYAIFVANSIDADLNFMHVRASKNFEVPFYFSKDKAMNHGKEPTDFCEIILNKYKDQVTNNFSYVIRDGKVYTEICNQAKYTNTFLIIMGTQGSSGFDEFFMGSNSFRVVANAPCPVITVRHGFMRRELKNIVIPIDKTPETRLKVNFVSELAKLFNAELHLVGVAGSNDKGDVKAVERNLNHIVPIIGKKKIAYRKELLIGSNITTLAIDYASQVAAELITIMTEQPSSPMNFVLGSYAQQMVNHSPIPVLTYRSFE